jgi:hypothetical protein
VQREKKKEIDMQRKIERKCLCCECERERGGVKKQKDRKKNVREK